MADSATVSFRKLCNEDFYTSATPAQVTASVMNAGPILLTPFVAAAGDAAAATAGVLVGEMYLNTGVTPNRLRVRMS